VRDYRTELAVMLLRISPFLADVEERMRQEQYVRGTVAHLFAAGIEPTVPPLPRVRYTQYAPRHPDGLALVMPAMMREIVRREEQAHVWALPVKDVAFIAEQFVNGLPVSGDDRPDVRRGGWR